jgi:hypothetical protein
VVLRRSIRIVVPQFSFLAGSRVCRGAGLFPLRGRFVRRLDRWTRSCFSLAATPVRAPILPPHVLTERPRSGFPGHALNATPNSQMAPRLPQPGRHPIQLSSRAVWPIIGAPRRPKIRADKPLPRCLSAGGSDHFGTLQGATGGTQTHSRRTGSKLGRLPRARQGLVRVPESNTKYGGKRGKPGVSRPLRSSQVSVSPQGFPREKIHVRGPRTGCARCSQGNYLLPPRGCSGETHVKLRESSGQACPGRHGRARP